MEAGNRGGGVAVAILDSPFPIPGPTMTRSEFLRLFAGAALLPFAARAAEPAYDFRFTRLMYESGDWDVDQRMPSNLIDALIQYTTLRVDPKEQVLSLADPRMLSASFCYLAGHKLVEFNPDERRNFETYVRNGGFVFVDDCNHDIDGLFAKSFEGEMARIFGADALKKLPKKHPVYSSFFIALAPKIVAICASNDLANRPSMSWLQSSTKTKPPLRT